MKRTTTTILLTSFIIIVAIWFTFMYWFFYPYKTFEVEQPYRVLTKEVKQGGLLRYEVKYCKFTNVNATVNRQFVDGIIYAVPETQTTLPVGCSTRIQTIEVPHTLPAAKYHLNVILDYQVNPVRTINHLYKTEEFSVVE